MLLPLLIILSFIQSYSSQDHSYIGKFSHINYSEEELSAQREGGDEILYNIKHHNMTLKLHRKEHGSALLTPLLASHPNHTLLTGIVLGMPESHAVGYFTPEGHFSGMIYLLNETLHLEPGVRFGYTSHNVLYARSDVNYSAVYPHIHHTQSPPDGRPPHADRKEFVVPRESVKKWSSDGHSYSKRGAGRDKKTCPVFLVADHLFYKHMGLSNEQTTNNELMLHLHEADKIFRSTDFDEDHVNDNIGFSVADITILKENTPQNKFSDSIIAVKEFLDRWSEYNHDQYCLAILFTYRDFDSGVLGLAWVASVDGAPGGICQKRQPVGGYNRNLNTAIVSLINFGRYVGHAVSFITVAHELGHNFGSSHDADTYECSPGLTGGGNYIMYARATDGNLPNNVKFSACSKKAINKVITSKSDNCFKVEMSYCGNKIKEWDEICDCGNSDTCSAIDPCCTPKYLDEGCTLNNRGPCSPQQGPCCDSACQFRSPSRQCEEEQDCRHSVYCNGNEGACPKALSKNNKTLCHEGVNTCYEGGCRGSVCQLVNLQECQCQKSDLCTVCCNESGVCRPTGSLLYADTNLTHLVSGRSCNNYRGYCNSAHECIQVNLENPLTTLEDIFTSKNIGNIIQWMKVHWYYTISIAFTTILLCVLLKVTYRKRAPIQKYMIQMSQTLRRTRTAHQRLPSVMENSRENQEALSRMMKMFPTASRSVTWEVRREAVNEEVAVCNMLALGYPLQSNAIL